MSLHLNKIKIPAKVTLFGEWAVLDKGPGIATTLDTYYSANYQPREEKGLQLIANQDSYCWLHPQKQVDGFFALACKTLQRSLSGSLEKIFPGILTLDRSWKLEEGLGSSSATVLALRVLSDLVKGVPKDKDALWKETLPFYRELQGGRASGLDLAAQIYGNTVSLQQGKVKELSLKSPNNLVLIHTGNKVSTSLMIQKTILSPPALDKIERSATRFLAEQNWEREIEKHYQALYDLNVVPDFVEEARDHWLQNNWITTLKTIGAGGGDGLLCLVNEPYKTELAADLNKRGWWVSPYTWQGHGLSVEKALH